jgi:hypothetical protein
MEESMIIVGEVVGTILAGIVIAVGTFMSFAALVGLVALLTKTAHWWGWL